MLKDVDMRPEPTRSVSRSGWLFSTVCLSLLICCLTAFSGYLYHELKLIQGQVTSNININEKDLATEQLRRYGRGRVGAGGAVGSTGSSGKTGSRSGEDGRPGLGNVPESQVYTSHYIAWGTRTCPKGLTLYESTEGVVSALHNSDQQPVPGSSLFCVPRPNDIGSGRTATTDLTLQPLKFDLHTHSSNFASLSNQAAYLFCSFCFILGADVMTVIGRPCPPTWTELYSGFIAAASTSSGTMESPCVISSAERVPSTSFMGSSQDTRPIQSGDRSLFTSPGRVVSCTVCSKPPDAES